MTAPQYRRLASRHFEPFMAFAILVGVSYALWFLLNYHYLPPPYFYETEDTFNDWFNVAIWARNNGTYDSWRSVYTPISFVFIRLLGIDRCYAAPSDPRNCDWLGIGAILVLFTVNLLLIWLCFRKIDRHTAIPRTICLGIGLPMSQLLERGNLVLASFICLMLAVAPILRSARLRWIAAGLAINFKIYAIAIFLPLLVKRKWLWVESVLLSTTIIYLFSYAILGRGTPIEIMDNIQFYSTLQGTSILDMWYTTTYQPLLTLLTTDRSTVPIVLILGSRNVEYAIFLIPFLQHLTQLLILLAFATTWLRPEITPNYRIMGLGILFAVISVETGGYTQIYFILFVLMEPWRGVGRCWAIIACYLLALPFDINLDRIPEMPRDTYFGNRSTLVSFAITLGPFIRPLLILTIAQALSLTTIRAVWNDIRAQGTRERWRFRNDAPILPWIEQPQPPA